MAAVPSASSDDAHTVVTVSDGPCRPYRMHSCAAAMLHQILIWVFGSTASGPARSIAHCALPSENRPPMEVPCTTAVRNGSSEPARPASSTACAHAARANRAKPSVPRTTRSSIHSAASKSSWTRPNSAGASAVDHGARPDAERAGHQGAVEALDGQTDGRHHAHARDRHVHPDILPTTAGQKCPRHGDAPQLGGGGVPPAPVTG